MGTLDDFTEETFTWQGEQKRLLRTGAGPAVVVMTEMPGITPAVADFSRRVAALGCTAVMPDLFGTAGRPPSVAYEVRSIARGCISREFTAFATRRTSPVAGWLRALCRREHERCGGPGVGAIGMCFTGGFALALMVDESVMAPVLSQPSLPLPLTRAQRSDLGISDEDLARVSERVAAGVCVLGLRFSHDRLVPQERFARLEEELGDGFVGVTIDSGPGNPHGNRRGAHSVLTEDLQDLEGHPTRDALDRVLEHFRTNLLEP